jgi:tetratricopeptide (TPR) repeat protein
MIRPNRAEERSGPGPAPADKTTVAPAAEAVREQLGRILESRPFAAHARASAFLAHVVERKLAGREGEVKEATIGVEVFGRPPLYDTKSDPLVRSVARVVREKLNDYYLGCPADAVRIELPKRTYVPVFQAAPTAAAAAVPAGGNEGRSDQGQPAVSPGRRRWRAAALYAAVGLAALLADGTGGRSAPEGSDPMALYAQGRAQYLAGDFPAARRLLERAVELAPTDAMAHALLAADLRSLSYDKRSLEEARAAELNSGGLGEREQLEIETIFRTVSGDFKAAADVVARLRKLDPERIEYLRWQTATMAARGQFTECLETIRRAGVADDAQLAAGESLCRANLGDFQGALEPVRRAAALARRSGVREMYARVRLLESGLLMSLGQGAEAAAIRGEVREVCSQTGDRGCEAKALRIQGNADLWTARPDVALADYRTAEALARELGADMERIELLNGEGTALLLLEDYEGAKKAFVESMLTAQKAGAPVNEQRLSLAETALQEGQLARAKMLAEQVRKDASDKAIDAVMAEAVDARALLLEGDLERSEERLKTTERMVEIGLLPNACQSEWMLVNAEASRLRGDLKSAAAEVERAKSAPEVSTEAALDEEQIEVLLGQGQYAEAREAARGTLERLRRLEWRSDAIRVAAMLGEALGSGGDGNAAKRTVLDALREVTDRTTPLARAEILIAAGRWAGSRQEQSEWARQAEAVARAHGFRLLAARAQQATSKLEPAGKSQEIKAAGQVATPNFFSHPNRSR